ncbi:MAG: formate--tetrahydrofolate ligase [Candidatus Omnitrophica bacterium]|jgi:formate--tetrahydrofolate ligase|nr:formate--tetrahydrofolate ligase [Candidatus Omnitrophota bacterium]
MQINRPKPMLLITEVARSVGIREDELSLYGPHKAKVGLSVFGRLVGKPYGRLICVSGINPTKQGEGKTCTSIGLTQGLGLLKKKAILCLREPSLAPFLGNKGGATGNGNAQVLPQEDINLHFTGDIHAVELATNLLAAAIDNHRHHGNKLGIDEHQVFWRRSLDICDRQLREVIVGAAKGAEEERYKTPFEITPASEVMSILSLSTSIPDLKKRLSDILVALTTDGRPVYARDLKVAGAMAALLKDALQPNVVQTSEGQAVFVHTGPFANVSHGNNSLIATLTGLKLAQYVVTESGFGTDLGMQKLFDVVLPNAPEVKPSVVVLVVTVKALKSHSNDSSFELGFKNLDKHVSNIRNYGVEPVVCINRFPQDTDSEIVILKSYLQTQKVLHAVCTSVRDGGKGALELAETVVDAASRKTTDFKRFVDPASSPEEKIRIIAQKMYGASDIVLSDKAKKDLELVHRLGLDHYPVNIAKNPFSLSDKPEDKGAPINWKLPVRGVRICAGARYLVILTGKLLLMPGMPEFPLFEKIDVTDEGFMTIAD